MATNIDVLALSAWMLVAKLTQDGRDVDEIQHMTDTARELEKLSGEDCSCTPINDCPVCNAVASLIYDEDYKNVR